MPPKSQLVAEGKIEPQGSEVTVWEMSDTMPPDVVTPKLVNPKLVNPKLAPASSPTARSPAARSPVTFPYGKFPSGKSSGSSIEPYPSAVYTSMPKSGSQSSHAQMRSVRCECGKLVKFVIQHVPET